MGEKRKRIWKIMFILINRLEHLIQRNFANMTFMGQKLSLLGKFMDIGVCVCVCPFFSLMVLFLRRISETIIIRHYKVRITQQGTNFISEKLMVQVKKGKSWNKLHHTYSENTCTPSSTPRNFHFKNMFYIKNIIFCGIQFFFRISILVVRLSKSTVCNIIKVENQGKNTCIFSFTECPYSLKFWKIIQTEGQNIKQSKYQQCYH